MSSRPAGAARLSDVTDAGAIMSNNRSDLSPSRRRQAPLPSDDFMAAAAASPLACAHQGAALLTPLARATRYENDVDRNSGVPEPEECAASRPGSADPIGSASAAEGDPRSTREHTGTLL